MEDRISFLEKKVRGFSIAVSGGAIVQGGFGKLPKTDQLEERLLNLERSFTEFNLTGEGVNIAGDIESGYIISS